ncbi:MAG: hypothetical protein PF447_10955 [Spirochaetaceae bacterium]|nr:hypothetical protein [Spirochaetaceae bacterium]
MQSKEPHRNLSEQERVVFKDLFKKEIQAGEVYKYKGVMEFISLRVNGVETREFFLGGIALNFRCTNRLGKTPHNIDFSSFVVKPSVQMEEQLRYLDDKYGKNIPSDEIEKLEDMTNSHSSSCEIVFPDGNKNKPGYLVSFREWRLVG